MNIHKTVAAVMLAMIPGLALASPASECKAFAQAAEAVMMIRQADVPMYEAMDLAEGVEAIAFLVYAAYKIRVYANGQQRRAAVVAFSNHMYMQCMEGQLKKFEGGSDKSEDGK